MDAERSLIMVKGSVPGAKNGAVDRAPEREGQGAEGREGSQIMELKVINEKGEAQKPRRRFRGSSSVATYNESLVHQVVVAYSANGRQGTRAAEDAQRSAPLDAASRGARRAPAARARA